MQLTVAVSEDPAILEPPQPRPKSKRNLVLLLLAIAATIGGGVFWILRHGRESTDDAQIDADVVLVPARVDGVVKKVLFVENQRVKAGDVLAEIDDSILAAKLAQAEAALARATAQAEAAEANAALAERNAVGNKSAARASLTGAAVGEKTEASQLLEGQAQLTAAQAQLEQAKTDVDRQRRLQTSGAGTKAELDQAE